MPCVIGLFISHIQYVTVGNVTTKGTTDVTRDEASTSEKPFTSIKDRSPNTSPERDPKTHIHSEVEEESVVCVSSRRKAHKESTTSSSCSDDSASPQESLLELKDTKDDNHNTVPIKKKKSRRAAIGFPSEVSEDAQAVPRSSGSGTSETSISSGRAGESGDPEKGIFLFEVNLC